MSLEQVRARGARPQRRRRVADPAKAPASEQGALVWGKMAVMTSDAETLVLLERALDQTEGLIAGVEPGQAGMATPCAGWDVRALVHHLAGPAMRNFLVAARGETTDWTAPAEEIGGDWAAVFRDRAAPLRATWRAAELAVHDWDLARATGQAAGLDPALAEHALGWSRGMLAPEFRGPDQYFGVEVPVADDAPVYDRLAGWFGRDPGWTPGVS
jgi:uncharacterized protein (TIGR03083 family)